MKKPCGIYIGQNDRTYLAVYNYQHDVSTLLPPEFRSAERVLRLSYSKGGKKGGVDVFLLKDGLPDVSEIAKIKKTISREDASLLSRLPEITRLTLFPQTLSGEEEFFIVNPDDGRGTNVIMESPEDIDRRYGIQQQIVAGLGEIGEEAASLARADVFYFCGREVSKSGREPKKEYVPRIIPVTKLERIRPERVLTGGKAEFVPQCFLEANIDFMNGCLTSWIPGENPSFDGETFTDYFSYPWGDCDYCYASRKHRSFPKTFYEFDQQRLLEELRGGARLKFGSEEEVGKPIDVLRFGKRTEPWTPFTSDEFSQTLEAMLVTGTRGVITTKFLPFFPEVAELLRRTKSTLLYSMGPNEIELGTIEHGCDNEFRLEQAKKYREAGVNSALYLLFHPVFPPTEENLGLINFARENRIPLQILPMRLINRDLAQKVISPFVGNQTGSLWDLLKDTDDPAQMSALPVAHYENTYYHQSGVLIPKISSMHEYWTGLVGENKGMIRMCHHDEDLTYCGGCFCNPGSITETELIQINPLNVKKRERPGKKSKNDSSQESLEL